MKWLNFALLAMAMAGCTRAPVLDTDTKSFADRLATYQSADCCVALQNMTVEPLQESSLVEFSMEENVEKIGLQTGSSFYKAIRLPDEKIKHYFILRSVVFEDEQTKQRAAVLPVVAILNDDFSLSRLSSLQALSYSPWNIWDPYDHFYIYIRVDREANPAERYVLIFTPAALLEKELNYSRSSSSWNLSIPTDAGLTTYPIQGRDINFDLLALPSGSLSIEHITNPLSKPYDYAVRF